MIAFQEMNVRLYSTKYLFQAEIQVLKKSRWKWSKWKLIVIPLNVHLDSLSWLKTRNWIIAKQLEMKSSYLHQQTPNDLML